MRLITQRTADLVCVCLHVCVVCKLKHIHADIFPENQLYVLMATENAGVALEDHKVHHISY